MTKLKSAVWRYVQKVGTNKAECLIEDCKQKEIGSQKTHNCKDHLRVHHREIYDKVQAEDEAASKKSVDEVPSNQKKLSFTLQPKKMSKPG